MNIGDEEEAVEVPLPMHPDVTPAGPVPVPEPEPQTVPA